MVCGFVLPKALRATRGPTFSLSIARSEFARRVAIPGQPASTDAASAISPLDTASLPEVAIDQVRICRSSELRERLSRTCRAREILPDATASRPFFSCALLPPVIRFIGLAAIEGAAKAETEPVLIALSIARVLVFALVLSKGIGPVAGRTTSPNARFDAKTSVRLASEARAWVLPTMWRLSLFHTAYIEAGRSASVVALDEYSVN